MLDRILTQTVKNKMTQYPVVVLEGMRDIGKTTLVKSLVKSDNSLVEYRSFQNEEELKAAETDPHNYVNSLPFGTIIDEAQLAEKITLPMKTLVDEDPRPGRFILTGSERLSRRTMGGSDPLVGRASPALRLRPLTLGEQLTNPTSIVDTLFSQELKQLNSDHITRRTLVELISLGGMPRLVSTPSLKKDANSWFNAYLNGVLSLPTYNQRDLRSLLSTFRYIAGQTSQIINLNRFGKETQKDWRTINSYIDRFESTFVVNKLPGWRNQKYKSETSSPKIHIADCGLAKQLGGLDVQNSPEDFGQLLETFVVNEMLSQSVSSIENPSLHHWRDSNRNEIDLLLTNDRSQVVCIEVKSSRTINEKSFKNIKFFANRYPNKFIAGYVFYLGENLLPFGDNLWALPVSALAAAQTRITH